jgi:alcohol dehydrogenase
MLPYVLEELAATRSSELHDVADIFGIATTDRNQAVREVCEAIRALIESIGIPTTLKELGVDEASLSSLLNDALAVTRLLKAFPVTDAKAAYERILRRAYDGELGEFQAAA